MGWDFGVLVLGLLLVVLYGLFVMGVCVSFVCFFFINGRTLVIFNVSRQVVVVGSSI